MLNWIAWNRTVLTFNSVNKNILILNWIVWNWTVYMYKNIFIIKWPTLIDMPYKSNQTKGIDTWDGFCLLIPDYTET